LATVQAFIEFTTEAVSEHTSGSMDKKLLQLLANLWIGLEAQPFRSYFLGVALHHSTKTSEQSGQLVAMDLLALTRDRVLYSRTDDIFAKQQIPLLAGVLNLLRFATPVELGHLEAFQCSSPPGPPDQLTVHPTSGAAPTTHALGAQLFSAPGPFSRSTTVWQGQGEESELVFKLTWMRPRDAIDQEPREVALYKEATMGVPESGAMAVPQFVTCGWLKDRIQQDRRPCVLCLKGRGSPISKDSISTVQGLLDFIESVWRSESPACPPAPSSQPPADYRALFERGVVQKDISLMNVLVVQAGGTPRALIIDLHAGMLVDPQKDWKAKDGWKHRAHEVTARPALPKLRLSTDPHRSRRNEIASATQPPLPAISHTTSGIFGKSSSPSCTSRPTSST
jgi:hypothetical protein